MKKLFVPFVACVLAACSSNEQQATSYDVIPLPQEITISQENPFKLSKNTVIAYPKDNDLLKRNAEFLAEYIAEATGYTLKTKAIENGEKPSKAIVLSLDSSIANAEGYRLTTQADGISICGQTANGVFFGSRCVLWHPDAPQVDPRSSYRCRHLAARRQSGRPTTLWLPRHAPRRRPPLLPHRVH